jgi:hypothetical protein
MFRKLVPLSFNFTKKYVTIQKSVIKNTNFKKLFLVSAILSAGITYSLQNKAQVKAEEKKEKENHVYKVVLTGGPCGGLISKLKLFKENLQL